MTVVDDIEDGNNVVVVVTDVVEAVLNVDRLCSDAVSVVFAIVVLNRVVEATVLLVSVVSAMVVTLTWVVFDVLDLVGVMDVAESIVVCVVSLFSGVFSAVVKLRVLDAVGAGVVSKASVVLGVVEVFGVHG
ncbi:hypothetical protein chiPu_0019856 [Chiloscyllium punctatum]|uniref:Uncharacterized protein n=1 Tax=Chiloscyllium punctatum TaxID=137246 RepID=A0A401RTC8_CHIPU|nr:hypothetical protein [Chiloscyllium punctatum]